MSKSVKVFGKWVLLSPVKDDLTNRTQLAIPDDQQKTQNIAKVVLKGEDCTVPLLRDDLVIHESSSFSLVLEGEDYVIVNEENIIGKVIDE